MKKQKNKQFKQIENQAQDGRSMVEMLGVLAIIGVLSIGGIAGYRWGMDKHITNQILYEMNLNSAQLAMLLQRGNADGVTLSLGSPYDEGNFRTPDYGFEYGCGEYATCGHACQYPDETMYFITATGLPKRVCNMLGDAVFNMAYYDDSEINGGANDHECKDADNTVTVFFDTNTTANNETSQQPGNSDNPYTPTPEVTAATPTTTDIYPSTYSSTEATTYTSSATYSPTTYTSSATYSSTEITTYTSTYTATPFVSTTGECGDKWCYSYEFCMSTGCSYPNNWNGLQENCQSYDCIPVAEYKAANKDSNSSYVMSNTPMNWWSAERFCEALPGSKRMVKISDLDCENKNLIETIGTGLCCDSNGDNGVFPSYYNTCKTDVSDIIKNLRRAYYGTDTIPNEGNSRMYWLEDPYPYDEDYVSAAYLVSDGGYVGSDSRDGDSGDKFALCK